MSEVMIGQGDRGVNIYFVIPNITMEQLYTRLESVEQYFYDLCGEYYTFRMSLVSRRSEGIQFSLRTDIEELELQEVHDVIRILRGETVPTS